MHILVNTGGGDAPGLNAVIRAVVRRAANHRFEVIGLRDGWKGLLEDQTFPLTRASTAGILHRGGTILGTSRINPFKVEGGVERVLENVRRHGIEAVVAIGGEGTLSAAGRLFEHGLPVVGIPKTIDNDLGGTDYTFGFDTAVSIATEAIDRLHSTAESHKRVIVVEVMGRHVGWIATHSGIAGGADVILVPEEPADLDQVAEQLRRRHAGGTSFSIVVVAEGTKIRSRPDEPEHVISSGAVDEAGRVRLGGVGAYVAAEIERRTGFESRVTILGHVQRGGSPVAFDRVLATRFGVAAMDAAAANRFGVIVALRGTQIVEVPLEQALREPKLLDPGLYETAELFFG